MKTLIENMIKDLKIGTATIKSVKAKLNNLEDFSLDVKRDNKKVLVKKLESFLSSLETAKGTALVPVKVEAKTTVEPVEPVEPVETVEPKTKVKEDTDNLTDFGEADTLVSEILKISNKVKANISLSIDTDKSLDTDIPSLIESSIRLWKFYIRQKQALKPVTQKIDDAGNTTNAQEYINFITKQNALHSYLNTILSSIEVTGDVTKGLTSDVSIRLLKSARVLLSTTDSENEALIFESLNSTSIMAYEKNTITAWRQVVKLVNTIIDGVKFDAEIAKKEDIWRPRHLYLKPAGKNFKLILEVNSENANKADEEYLKRLKAHREGQAKTLNVSNYVSKNFKAKLKEAKKASKKEMLTSTEMLKISTEISVDSLIHMIQAGGKLTESQKAQLAQILGI